jgi:hypothetical protein
MHGGGAHVAAPSSAHPEAGRCDAARRSSPRTPCAPAMNAVGSVVLGSLHAYGQHRAVGTAHDHFGNAAERKTR